MKYDFLCCKIFYKHVFVCVCVCVAVEVCDIINANNARGKINKLSKRPHTHTHTSGIKCRELPNEGNNSRTQETTHDFTATTRSC